MLNMYTGIVPIITLLIYC